GRLRRRGGGLDRFLTRIFHGAHHQLLTADASDGPARPLRARRVQRKGGAFAAALLSPTGAASRAAVRVCCRKAKQGSSTATPAGFAGPASCPRPGLPHPGTGQTPRRAWPCASHLTLHKRAPYHFFFDRVHFFSTSGSPTLTIEAGVELR